MADNIQYGMGQLRYNGSQYMESVSFTPTLAKIPISTENTSNYYQDVLLIPDNNDFQFIAGTPYLLKLKIPRDLSYDNTFRIKIMETNGISTESATGSKIIGQQVNYQILKYINVPRDTANKNSSHIILYPVNSNNQPGTNNDGSYTTKVSIVLDAADLPDDYIKQNGDIVFENNRYWLYSNNTNNVEITKKNDIVLTHSWTTVESENFSEFNIVFTPRTPDEMYKYIWIELFRQTEDTNIFNDGIYGRQVNINSAYFNVEVFQIHNLLNNESFIPVSALTHIGIYSHPNLIMAINGEEIRIGQTGYYELNNFDITSLGIVAENETDRFTLDYQYERTIS